jgi:hypothetical protein
MKNILLLFASVLSVLSVETHVTFASDFKMKTTISMLTTTLEGKVWVDNFLQRVKMNPTKASLEFNTDGMDGMMGDMDMMDMGGTGRRLAFQMAQKEMHRRVGFQIGQKVHEKVHAKGHARSLQEIDIPEDLHELLMYDLKGNYTWYKGADGKKYGQCSKLEPEENPWTDFMVDPLAVQKGSETITVKNVQVFADKYTSDLSFDEYFKMTATYWVKDKGVVKVEFSIKAADGLAKESGDMMSSTMTWELWNIKGEVSDSVWTPDQSYPVQCTKAEAPKVEIAVYPTKVDKVEDVQCETKSEFCKCLEGDDLKLDYCGTINWPVKKAIFPEQTDNFVKEVVEGVAGGFDDECTADVKQWYCQFYFQMCKDGELARPAAFDIEKFTNCDQAAASKVHESAAGSGYKIANIALDAKGTEAEYSFASTVAPAFLSLAAALL